MHVDIILGCIIGATQLNVMGTLAFIAVEAVSMTTDGGWKSLCVMPSTVSEVLIGVQSTMRSRTSSLYLNVFQ